MAHSAWWSTPSCLTFWKRLQRKVLRIPDWSWFWLPGKEVSSKSPLNPVPVSYQKPLQNFIRYSSTNKKVNSKKTKSPSHQASEPCETTFFDPQSDSRPQSLHLPTSQKERTTSHGRIAPSAIVPTYESRPVFEETQQRQCASWKAWDLWDTLLTLRILHHAISW